MPTLSKRKPDEVPSRIRSSKAVQDVQRLYDGFIRDIGADVGELELGPTEAVRSVKVRLRRAATRTGTELQIWDANGKVYFSRTARRGRPRKTQ
jgi:hypothetical protein